jgi:heat-inducible transcriptional repressor
MDDRKRWVLKAIVDHYIKTGRPVSSQTLLEDYGLEVSSATIRNDMKVLEEQGLIAKEYSSAGRIPTEQGFRFFVDWLLELGELARQEQHAIMESYRFQRQEIGELLRQTVLLLAGLSGYAGFVLSPRLEETRLESILFVKLDPEHVMVVIVSELGIVEHRVVHSQLSDEDLQGISSLLNESLRGKTLDEVRAEALKYAQREGWYDPLVQSAFTLLKETLERRLERHLYSEGLFSLLQALLEEGHDLEEARRIAEVLGDPQRFGQYLESEAGPEIQVRIGSENALLELRPCSLVFMGYGFSGVLGVLGPIRMDYSKAFSVTTYIGNRLEAILTLSHRESALTLEREVNPS